MQKQVSKQSLAIVALSILLAICMALTATYAAFSNQRNVTGQITFVAPTLTLTVYDTAGAVKETGDVEFTIAQSDFVFASDADTVSLNAAKKAQLNNIKWKLEGSNLNLGSVAGTNKIQISIAYSTSDGNVSAAALLPLTTFDNEITSEAELTAVGTAATFFDINDNLAYSTLSTMIGEAQNHQINVKVTIDVVVVPNA